MQRKQPTSGLDRREFLKVGGVGGLALTAGAAACAPVPEEGGPGPVEDAHRWSVPAFELDEITVEDLQAGMASGQWSAADITGAYLDRIAAIDQQGPMLRSVIETNPDALRIAQDLDAERAAGQVRGPLHGIPVLIKDNIGTADRMTTTAGSLALEGSIPPNDAYVAQKLREAGAVILGKANLSEWANFRSERSSSGWSGRGGQCGNPYALHRNPCGSSSGSGAAVSANLAALAIGTETNGSIVCPSSACGVVGIKPTVGLWSRSVIIPISHSQDTAGPMTRTVRDGAILLGAITGVDGRDPATDASVGNSHADYTQFLDPEGLRGARIGVVRASFGFDERVDRALEEGLQAMRDGGAEIVDDVEIPNQQGLGDAAYDVLLYEFKADLNAYLEALGPGAPIRTLEDAIRFNDDNRDREMPYFGQEIFLAAQAKGPLTDQAYLDALERVQRSSGAEGIDAAMDQHTLDALVAPTGGPAWVTDHVNGDHFGGGSSSPAARSGYPNITVPAGFVMGLPVGMSFFGRRWSEPTLLRIAHAFEQATQVRRAPGFRTSDDVSVIS
jgi:amidase